MALTLHPTAEPTMMAPKAWVLKMTAEDDPEAYLVAFERLATTASWPWEFSASHLGPCLIGGGGSGSIPGTEQHGRHQLRPGEAGHSPSSQHHREYQRSPDTHPRVVVERLCDHMVHWLTPAKKTNLQMGEAVVVEQFYHVVGTETQAWIRRHNPDTLEKVVKLAEDFEDSLVSTQTWILPAPVHHSSRAPPPLSLPPPPPPALGSRPPRPPTPMGHLASPSWRPRLALSQGRGASPAPLPDQQRDRYLTSVPSVPPACLRCNQPGHLARSCPAAMECDVTACNWAPEIGVTVQERPYRILESRRSGVRKEL
ncbi:uncharacterized protein LOC131699403 isoform X2 [Acipenser ruthenus]|uniref:uncharacterized protein LOC131699403 isoform X2 n=1 Tax=Acipenser ruthenus TaxID=7906 RepID=UPI0027407778|nr:uncharacterized protein LOC131699403 isoform X2 [Acipenser ruthenus]